jgi:CYTH domain-containing protein
MVELEREKTYLLKELPADLDQWRSEIISDAYIPVFAEHPVIRVRRRGDRYEITKKEPVQSGDASRQNEHTITLDQEEFAALNGLEARRFTKRRFYGIIDGHKAELDLYQDALDGLAVLDFEFDNDADLQNFSPPDLCLADVTQDSAVAGGMLAGKTYADLQDTLKKYNYQPIRSGE